MKMKIETHTIFPLVFLAALGATRWLIAGQRFSSSPVSNHSVAWTIQVGHQKMKTIMSGDVAMLCHMILVALSCIDHC